MISRLRIEPDGKKTRITIDGEDLVTRMRKVWPDIGGNPHGIAYRDVVVDAAELVRTANALRETSGQTLTAGIFNCSDCGTVGCTGINAVSITHDGYELHWSVPPVSLEVSALEFTFDPRQYLREIDRLAKSAPEAPTRTARIAAKKSKAAAKSKRPARAAKSSAKKPAKKTSSKRAKTK